MTGTAARRPASSVPRTIRRATVLDVADVVHLRLALRREERELAGPGLVPDESGGALRDLTRRQLADDSQCWLLALASEATCGVLRCAIKRRDGVPVHAVITTAYVEPDHRRCGVLRAMVAMACAWANERGVRDLRVRTNSGNAPANAAWEALGFLPAQVIRQRVLP
jgi:ribosomal protein S18 acetylase RimI-like enzyme